MDLADRVLSGRLTVRETRAETKGKKPATARPITNDPIFSRIEALGKAVDKGVSQRSAREKAQIKSKIMAIIRKIEV